MKKEILLAAMFAAVGCGRNVPQSSKVAAVNSATVCEKSDVPDGWVVVAHESSMDCPFPMRLWNTYVVRQPGDFETVCDDSPIPSGYIKGRRLRDIGCRIPSFVSRDYTNAIEIRKI